MAFRFWRRERLLPGVTLNLSGSSASLSFGPPGARLTLGPDGGRVTAGVPGTGLFYTVGMTRPETGRRSMKRVEDRLDLGFLRRLFVPAGEEAFVDGLRALQEGDHDRALGKLEAASELPDAAWMAGMLHLKRGDLAAAERRLATALAGGEALGRLYASYDIDAVVDLPITEETTAHVRPRPRGTRLALAEVRQRLGDVDGARELLRRVLDEAPRDVVAALSLADVLLDAEPVPPEDAEAVVRMTAGAENETAVHAALLLEKARALRMLDMPEAAVATLTRAWRRRKDRPADLLRRIRYERALAYAESDRADRARRELQAIYAEAPDYEDVAERLGRG